MDQLICFWKFGPQCPTSPLLPPWKDPLEDFDCNAPKIHRTTFMHFTNLLGHFGNFKCYVSAELLKSAGKMRCGWFQQVTPRSDARAGF
ncbi:putative LRR receptor-like serine/threonine-protein kinase-like [Dorcoceras hygrometricum]|uniref:Putative LRR receptor-like serine/threonine-protein kinase-like n=1 Tax=Dorcoceras hygrometricum TaxID=472368 RepID=A0A2Z7BW80_9LAMI|nr:putative LRR receptor-like serine/threonine-protein kinase-like [Dorcoceras hygrometricum]